MRATRTSSVSGWLCSVVILWSQAAEGGPCADCKRRGRLAYAAGDYQRALQLFQRVNAQLEPDVLVSIGYCQLQLGRYREALQACQRYSDTTEQAGAEGLRAETQGCLAKARQGLQAAEPNKQPPTQPGPLPAEPVDAAKPTPPPGPPEPISNEVPTEVPAQAAPEPPAASTVPPLQAQPAEPAQLAPPRFSYQLRLTDPPRPPAATWQATPSPTPWPAAPPNPAWPGPMSRQRNSALWSAGLTLWLSSYAAAAAFGVAQGFQSTSNPEVAPFPAQYYYMLAAPVVGPFLSGILFPLQDQVNRDYLLLGWTLPWIAGDGVAQIAGLAMVLAGAARRPTALRVLGGMHILVRPGLGQVAWSTNI